MKKLFIPIIIICLVAYIIGYTTTTKTTNLELVKIASEDVTTDWFENANDNMDLIDAVFDTVTLTEFAFLDGVTSNIQDQLDAKPDTDTDTTYTAGTGLTLTGTVFSSKDSEIVHDNLSGFVANEHIDWTADQGATDIHAGNYTDTNTTYTGTVDEIVLTGTVFSLDAKIARDTELHTQNTDTDLDATFEATFGKHTDKLSAFAATTSAELAGVISDETGTGALVFGTTPTLTTPVIGAATGTSLDLGGTTLYDSRAITVDTGGVLNIALGDASGDDFTVDTDKLVVSGDTGFIGIGIANPTNILHIYKASDNLITKLDQVGAGNFYAGYIASTSDCNVNFAAYNDGYTDVSAYTGKAGIQAGGGNFFISAFTASTDIEFYAGGRKATELAMTIKGTNRNIGINGVTSPTAKVHIAAGTATASTAPLKFTAGTLLTTPEVGALEMDSTNLYFTRTGTTREIIGTIITKTDTGDPTGAEGLFCINTFDDTFKVYADGGWRELATDWTP